MANGEKFVSTAERVEEHVEEQEVRKPAWAIIEAVGKRIGDIEWYRSFFNGKTKKQLERNGISPDLVEHFIQKLERGRYIGPLETQPVSWSDTKIYRDIVQNFFDGMKDVTGRPTLDGVEFSHNTIKEKGGSQVEFTIQSPAEYDHRYLIHHGGTTKFGDESVVGEFGEGLKIASFLLTKQGVTDKIELGSDHWRATYYLDELPQDEYPEKVRGLYLRAKFVKKGIKGNYLRFRTDKHRAQSIQSTFQEMQKFFWHEGHPDFQDSTYENDFGGFRFLPRQDKGNLYIAGQRHEYSKDEAWSYAVPGAHVWTFKKVLERKRDRNYVAPWDVEDKIIHPIIESMTKEDLQLAFRKGKNYWIQRKSDSRANMGDEIFREVAKRLAEELSGDEKKELLKEFPEKLFVERGGTDTEYAKMLKRVGYSPCISVFSEFGVPSAREKILALVDTAKTPKLEKWEKQRVDVLKDAIQVFIENAGYEIINKYGKFLLSPADKQYNDFDDDPYNDSDDWGSSSIDDNWGRLSVHDVLGRISSGKLPELTIRETDSLHLKGEAGRIELHGFTTLFPENIFLQRKLLRENFLGALFTWAHELAHNISGEGNDFSAGFTDAERYLHELLLISSFEGDKLKQLQEKWEKIKTIDQKSKSKNI